MQVELNFLPLDQFRDMLTRTEGIDLASAQGMSGVTFMEGRRCVVYVPSGTNVWMQPSEGWASFADYQGSNLAHELMHCAYGLWHPAWSSVNEFRHKHSMPVDQNPVDGIRLLWFAKLGRMVGDPHWTEYNLWQ